MEIVSAFVYCDGDMIPWYEGIVFEYSSGSKAIKISKNMLLDVLRKTIFYTDGWEIVEFYLIFFTVNQFK